MVFAHLSYPYVVFDTFFIIAILMLAATITVQKVHVWFIWFCFKTLKFTEILANL